MTRINNINHAVNQHILAYNNKYVWRRINNKMIIYITDNGHHNFIRVLLYYHLHDSIFFSLVTYTRR